MSEQNKVTGVVLAGGLARRMAQQDKGLLLLNQQPLVSYALAAMKPITNEIFISANRNRDLYGQLGYTVIDDGNDAYDGPLAGILAAMQAAHHPVLLVMPCDSPLLKTSHCQKLLQAISATVDIAVGCDGERLHPVFAALKIRLKTDLQSYLNSGERKLQCWFERHVMVKVDFSNTPEIFANINTPEQLQMLEKSRISTVKK